MVDNKTVREPRVRRPEKYDAMLEDLKSKNIFEKYTNALIFAACVGFKRGKKSDFDSSGEPVRLPLFNDQYDEAVMNALAILENNGDPFMLAKLNEEAKISIFERYACGGLEILAHQIWEPGLDWEKSIVSMILDEFEQGVNLTILTNEFSSLSEL
jgi:dnd system-associated protein 4